MHRRAFTPLFVIFAILLAPCLHADVKLPSIFGDHMVLEHGIAVPVWGTAAAGEAVTIACGNQKVETRAGSDGRWQVRLAPLGAGGPIELTVAGTNTITFRDVLVGEVWVCSGQSNMQMSVRSSANPEQEIAQAAYPNIRLFSVARVVAQAPRTDTEGSWSVCSPQTIPDFSAVAYFFGRDVHKALNVPIGLIHTSWGGTPAESWTTRETLDSYPEFEPIMTRWAKIAADYPEAMKRYKEQRDAWDKAVDKAKAEGKPAPPQPGGPPMGPDHPHWPAGLYNGMIAPIVPYAIKGAIWYQGESNAGRAYQYRSLFPAMIRDWRDRWGQGDFPFLFVQLANFMAVKAEPGDSAWAELREAQTMTLALARTGMAVAIDIGDANDIHPKNKQEVGRRLALAAQGIGGGKDIVDSGPIFEHAAVEGNRIRLHFTDVGGGLACRGDALAGFAIAGQDRKFVWAQAAIDGDTVVAWSEKVPEPVAVRYAWADNPVCNLFNKANLPATPFRTDSWPGTTAKSE
jgi:sialate O-acetylesterase